MTTALATDVWYVYKQYVWDIRYIDAPIYRLRDDSPPTGSGDDNAMDEQYYYTTDANMNVTALINASTGNVEERYTYDPYGKPTFYSGSFATRSSSTEDNRILFAGYHHDPETGLYKARHRDHHPLLGRWINRDPKDQDVVAGGYHDGMNLYQYVMSNPVSIVDPSGTVVKYVEISNTEGAQDVDFVATGANDAMASYKKMINTLNSATGDASYAKAQAENDKADPDPEKGVFWNGERYSGTKADYIALLQREYDGYAHVVMKTGGVEASVTKAKEFMGVLTEDDDVLVVSAHASMRWVREKDERVAHVEIQGVHMVQADVKAKFSTALAGLGGEFLFVSCYQDGPTILESVYIQSVTEWSETDCIFRAGPMTATVTKVIAGSEAE
jgi:RHS repeat-associated protein